MTQVDIPQPLIDDIEAGRCLPFIGAGFSLNARLPKQMCMPTWQTLKEILARTAGVPVELEGPEVALRFEKRFGRVQLIEAIRKALYMGHAEPGEAHKAFTDLSFDTIYTTNFDLLLEDSFSLTNSPHKPFRSIVGDLQMPFHGGPLITNIIKMHGDLRHEEHIIITSEDYNKYLVNYPVIATHLSALLITKTPLFIGYSLSDPDFQNIRRVLKERLGKFERMGYIIEFNKDTDEIETKLQDKLHVISVQLEPNESKDSKLAEVFLEIQRRLDTQEGARFREFRPESFEAIPAETFSAASQTVDASSLLAGYSNLCFVMMPFSPEFSMIYNNLIKPSVELFGLTVLRADEIYATGSIIEQIRTAIKQSRLCIADMSGRNPNVGYEIGIAHTLKKPTILLTRDLSDTPFDLLSMRFVLYDINRLELARPVLERTIQQALGADRLSEAERLIDTRMYRAAAATLGVLLEHSFLQLLEKLPDESHRYKKRQKLGIGQLLTVLIEGGIIRNEDQAQLKEVVKLRNLASHDLKEPSEDEVRSMLSTILSFMHSYLP